MDDDEFPAKFCKQLNKIIRSARDNVVGEVNRQFDAQADSLYKLILDEVKRPIPESTAGSSSLQDGYQDEVQSNSNNSIPSYTPSTSYSSAVVVNATNYQPHGIVQAGRPQNVTSVAIKRANTTIGHTLPNKKPNSSKSPEKSSPKKLTTTISKSKDKSTASSSSSSSSKPYGPHAPKYYRLVSLNCPVPNCPYASLNDPNQLQEHLLAVHNIHKYRCVILGCEAHFPSSAELVDHQKSHTECPPWRCSACDNTLKSLKSLQGHKKNFHQLGKFVCTYTGCSFIGNFRQSVVSHYRHVHEEVINYTCDYEGCTKSFTRISNLETHKRCVHKDAKPYKCTWPGCYYEAKHIGSITQHIRFNHFGLPKNICEQKSLGIVDDRDPRNYMEIHKELF